MVKLRTAQKNKVNNICSAHGVNLNKESLSSEKGFRAVLEIRFDPLVNLELKIIIDQIRSLNRSIAELEETIGKEGQKLEGYKNLTTLMAGDAADLVFTDPPYNVDYEGYTEDRLKIKGDRMSDAEFKQFLERAFRSSKGRSEARRLVVCLPSSSCQREFQNAAKNTFAWGLGRYKFQHEPIFYLHVAGERIRGTVTNHSRRCGKKKNRSEPPTPDSQAGGVDRPCAAQKQLATGGHSMRSLGTAGRWPHEYSAVNASSQQSKPNFAQAIRKSWACAWGCRIGRRNSGWSSRQTQAAEVELWRLEETTRCWSALDGTPPLAGAFQRSPELFKKFRLFP